ncbi:MAG: RNA-processing protein [Methanocalculaceae archaeon]|jgi:nucleolar protein 56|nr:RNA-processing protein [Methanocalculaceae archaeon]
MYWYGSGINVSVDPTEVAARLREAKIDMTIYVPCDWKHAQQLGLVRNRQEYLQAIRQATTYIAEEGITAASREKDVELLQMIRTLDEMDKAINLLTERLIDWYISITPSFSRKYRRSETGASRLLPMIGKMEKDPMKKIAMEILSMSTTRTDLMKEVSRKAVVVIPNMSALVGGLVAARLVSRVGGLAVVAKMPGSSIQVIGAEGALFSHIRTGTPSPKHGIMFQHRRVHNAPREIRGAVARALAAKLAIAARLDYYRGEIDPVFVDAANVRIDGLMGMKTREKK